MEDLRLEKERWELVDNVVIYSFFACIIDLKLTFAILMGMISFFFLWQDDQSLPSAVDYAL